MYYVWLFLKRWDASDGSYILRMCAKKLFLPGCPTDAVDKTAVRCFVLKAATVHFNNGNH
jgi:hypothetical protein